MMTVSEVMASFGGSTEKLFERAKAEGWSDPWNGDSAYSSWYDAALYLAKLTGYTGEERATVRVCQTVSLTDDPELGFEI